MRNKFSQALSNLDGTSSAKDIILTKMAEMNSQGALRFLWATITGDRGWKKLRRIFDYLNSVWWEEFWKEWEE